MVTVKNRQRHRMNLLCLKSKPRMKQVADLAKLLNRIRIKCQNRSLRRSSSLSLLISKKSNLWTRNWRMIEQCIDNNSRRADHEANLRFMLRICRGRFKLDGQQLVYQCSQSVTKTTSFYLKAAVNTPLVDTKNLTTAKCRRKLRGFNRHKRPIDHIPTYKSQVAVLVNNCKERKSPSLTTLLKVERTITSHSLDWHRCRIQRWGTAAATNLSLKAHHFAKESLWATSFWNLGDQEWTTTWFDCTI